MLKLCEFNSLFRSARSDSSSIESSSVELPELCVVCGCRLFVDNRSERADNVCEECMQSLEF